MSPITGTICHVCSNDGQYWLYCSANKGLFFGGDGKHLKDKVIRSYSNTKQKSHSYIGYAYKHPIYQRNTQKSSILAGSHRFHIEEIEIYDKTDF